MQTLKLLCVILIIQNLMGCGLRGWFPGYTDPQPAPAQGCNKDLNVHYKNNCTKNLKMYFIEVNPGTTVACENLNDYGTISQNEIKSVTVHKGKVGYFVFAEDAEGKCTGGHRKAEYWVNCEQSTSDEATFDVCH